MDEEDEKFIAQLESDIRAYGRIQSDSYALLNPELRSFENLERQELAKNPNIDLPTYATLRVGRFIQTLSGFCFGSTDLSGRHPSRFQHLTQRFREFASDLQPFPRSPIPLDPNSINLEYSASCVTFHDVPSDEFYLLGRKWRVPYDPNQKNVFYTLIAVTDCAQALLHHYPEPIFQKLCFSSLPTEILLSTLDFADHDSIRRLGATNRFFRKLTVPYTNRHRSFNFSSRAVGRGLRPRDRLAGQIPLLERQAMLDTNRDSLIEQMQAIIQNRRLAESIEHLSLGGLSPQYNIGHFYRDIHCEKFYRPLLATLRTLFSKARNIRSVTIDSWNLSYELVPCISALPCLQTLHIEDCNIYMRYPFIRGTLGAKTFPSSSILNAMIRFRLDSSKAGWDFLRSVPHLRVLAIVRQWGTGQFPIFGYSPLSSIFGPTSGLNLLKSVERLLITRLDSSEVDVLNTWLLRARRSSPTSLRFTHLKIGTMTGMTRTQIMNLLEALEGSPMRFLSLDGIRFAQPSLFAEIARSLPGLESLSLLHRQSFSEQTSCVSWPAALWEYANALKRFHNLKHLIWNLRMDEFEFLQYPERGVLLAEVWPEVQYCDEIQYQPSEEARSNDDNDELPPGPEPIVTPAMIEEVEQVLVPVDTDSVNWFHPGLEDVMEEWTTGSKLLAVSCRSLKSVTFMTVNGPFAQAVIKRFADDVDKVQVDMIEECDALDLEELDPKETWPRVSCRRAEV